MAIPKGLVTLAGYRLSPEYLVRKERGIEMTREELVKNSRAYVSRLLMENSKD